MNIQLLTKEGKYMKNKKLIITLAILTLFTMLIVARNMRIKQALSTHMASVEQKTNDQNEYVGYYYRKLPDGSLAKSLYDSMELMYKNGTFESGEKYSFSSNPYEGEEDAVFSQDKLKEYYKDPANFTNQMEIAKDAFFADYPELFYVDKDLLIATVTKDKYNAYFVEIASSKAPNYFISGFVTKEEVQTAKNQYETAINQIVTAAQTAGNSQKVDQIQYVHDTMIGSVSSANSSGTVNTSYGAIVNKQASAEGLSKAMKAILDRLNITSIIAEGVYRETINSTREHTWNYVQLDSAWYGLDVNLDRMLNTSLTIQNEEKAANMQNLEDIAITAESNRTRALAEEDTTSKFCNKYLLVGKTTMLRHIPIGINVNVNFEFEYPNIASESVAITRNIPEGSEEEDLTFIENVKTISIISVGNKGTMTISEKTSIKSGVFLIRENENVILTARAADGYLFKSVAVAGNSVTISDDKKQVNYKIKYTDLKTGNNLIIAEFSEETTTQPTPVEPTPLETMPVEPTPVEPTPLEPTPEEIEIKAAEIMDMPSFKEVIAGNSLIINPQVRTYEGFHSYQWKKDDVIIAGQNTGMLEINNVDLIDAGNYTLEVITTVNDKTVSVESIVCEVIVKVSEPTPTENVEQYPDFNDNPYTEPTPDQTSQTSTPIPDNTQNHPSAPTPTQKPKPSTSGTTFPGSTGTGTTASTPTPSPVATQSPSPKTQTSTTTKTEYGTKVDTKGVKETAEGKKGISLLGIILVLSALVGCGWVIKVKVIDAKKGHE